MHIHNVYFWLESGEADAEFEAGLKLLSEDENVRNGYYGRPASTDRDVVENSYTYGLVLAFDDLAGHDAYQAGANHMKFLDGNMRKWTKVIVYDIEM